jgi:NADH:ubiquinone oxidoreductase subunit 5 (subunit L)/multisubunit Na+/H+ antiporter MnhA subunit
VRSAFPIIVLLGLLILAIVIGFWAWQQIGSVEIGTHGWIALGLGALLTFAVGAGLMALMFFSARRGYDERAHQANRGHADHWERPPGEDR